MIEVVTIEVGQLRNILDEAMKPLKDELKVVKSLLGEKKFTIKEVSEATGIPPHTIRRQCNNGSINAERVGRDFYITATEVARIGTKKVQETPIPKILNKHKSRKNDYKGRRK